MTSPISAQTIPRPGVAVAASPLSIILVVPKIDLVPAANVTIAPAEDQLTEITSANVLAQLGALAAANAAVQSPIQRAAYDYIETRGSARLWVLPFEVMAAHTAAERATAVVAALDAVRTSPVEKAKLLNDRADVVVVPGETAVGTAANAVIGALRSFCVDNTGLGCAAWVDAGGYAYDNDARPGAAEPTQADVITWEGNNRDINIFSISNRGNVANYNSMWGSVIAAGHVVEYTSTEGFYSNPFSLRHPLRGVLGAEFPAREFNLGDGSSSAVVLNRDNHVGSIVTWNGMNFIEGGETFSALADPRMEFGNNITSHRMIDHARRLAAPFRKLRASERRLASFQTTLQAQLDANYVPGAVRRVSVLRPVINADQMIADFEVFYYGFIKSIVLRALVQTETP